MAAFYDYYDYPSYWIGREYEHLAEVSVLSNYIKKIPKIDNILEIGTGYGRLVPYYQYRAGKIFLSDPSSRLLSIARSIYPQKKFHYLHSSLYNLPKKIKKSSIELCIMVRVLHHIEDIDLAFNTINKLLKSNGFLIIEFANKKHLKEVIKQIFSGNITYSLDIFPKDIRSIMSLKEKNIIFNNYHPDFIIEKLKNHNFDIIEKKSVSNIRWPITKKYLGINTLLSLEKYLEPVFTLFDFGPSIFILARKKSS